MAMGDTMTRIMYVQLDDPRRPPEPTSNALMRKTYANITSEYINKHAVMLPLGVKLTSLNPEGLVAILSAYSPSASPLLLAGPYFVHWEGHHCPRTRRPRPPTYPPNA